jgi:hypothetical protein
LSWLFGILLFLGFIVGTPLTAFKEVPREKLGFFGRLFAFAASFIPLLIFVALLNFTDLSFLGATYATLGIFIGLTLILSAIGVAAYGVYVVIRKIGN